MDRKIDSRNKMSEAYLDPNYLVEKLNSILFKNTQHLVGHIHFYFRSKSDHIILIWSKGILKQIVAKAPDCKKGECIEWENSQFCDYKREDALRKLYNEIEYIEIDEDNFNKTWSSYAEFIKWLAKVENKPV